MLFTNYKMLYLMWTRRVADMRGSGPSNLALDETVGPRLGGVDLGIRAGVLEPLVPAQV